MATKGTIRTTIWKKKNPDKVKEYNKISYKKMWANPEYRDKKRKESLDRVKKQKEIVYNNYGMICNCCGETNPMFLTIDHVHNDGYKEKTSSGNRKSGTTMYRQIISNNFPDTYQILCMNCNFGKARNKGICPHKNVCQ